MIIVNIKINKKNWHKVYKSSKNVRKSANLPKLTEKSSKSSKTDKKIFQIFQNWQKNLPNLPKLTKKSSKSSKTDNKKYHPNLPKIRTIIFIYIYFFHSFIPLNMENYETKDTYTDVTQLIRKMITSQNDIKLQKKMKILPNLIVCGF